MKNEIKRDIFKFGRIQEKPFSLVVSEVSLLFQSRRMPGNSGGGATSNVVGMICPGFE